MPKHNGKVQYRGNWTDEYNAPYLVKSDIHSLLEKDRRMILPEIQEWHQMPFLGQRSIVSTSRKDISRPQAMDINDQQDESINRILKLQHGNHHAVSISGYPLPEDSDMKNISTGYWPPDYTGPATMQSDELSPADEAALLFVLGILGLPEDMLIIGGIRFTAGSIKFLKEALKLKRSGFNPFKGKTPQQIQKMFEHKGFEFRGPNPLEGYGGYVNPKTLRSYHTDYNHPIKPPHVDVNRPKGYKGELDKKRFYK